MITDRVIIDEFICEAREHISNVEADFLKVEKQSAAVSPDVINRIFRSIHTIKGGAGFLGCTTISKLAHTMETILSMARDGTMQLRTETTGALLEGIDSLRYLFDNFDKSNTIDISQISKKLDDILNGQVPENVRKDIGTQIVVHTTDPEVSFEITNQDLKQVPTEHLHFYVLTYDLKNFEKQKGYSPVKLVRELLKMGTIVDGYLTVPKGDLHQGIPGDTLEYKLLYATMADTDLIATSVELDMQNIQPVDKSYFVKKEGQDTVPVRNDNAQTTINQESAHAETPAPIDTAGKKDDNTVPATMLETASDESSAQKNETIRIRVDILDRLMLLAGELVLVRNQELMNVDKNNAASRAIAQRLDVVTTDLQETIMRTRMQPIGSIYSRFSRVVRDLGIKLNKQIELEMFGKEVELDKTILETLVDPLVHIIRNSCDHGIEEPSVRLQQNKSETGHITLRAYHEGGQMIIEVGDDGRGIDIERVRKKVIEKGLKTEKELAVISPKEILTFIFLPGFSTIDTISDVSGRGVGMDVVKTSIERLGGVIDIKSERGTGTTIMLRLPLTLAIIPSLIIQDKSERYAIPQINLVELVRLYDEDVYTRIEYAGSREVYRLRDQLLPIVHLPEIFAHDSTLTAEDLALITEKTMKQRQMDHQEYLEAKNRGEPPPRSLTIAILKAGNLQFGLCIEKVMGTEEIVVKPMHRAIKYLEIYSGATVLGDGRIALILDTLGIARHAGVTFNEQDKAAVLSKNASANQNKKGLLLFRSGKEEIFAVEMSMVKRVEKINIATIERVGGIEFISVNGISTRVITLDSSLNVSPCVRTDEMFLLIPKKSDVPVGILLAQLIDIGEFNVAMNTQSYISDGIMGSAIIKGHMTLFLDMNAILSREV